MPARMLDQLFGTIAACFCLFYIFWSLHLGFLRSMILGATISVLLWILYRLIREIRLKKLIQKKEEAIASNLMIEQFLFMDQAQQNNVIQHVFQETHGLAHLEKTKNGWFDCITATFCAMLSKYPDEPVSSGDILSLCRQLKQLHAKRCILLITGNIQPSAKSMACRAVEHLQILEQDAILHSLEELGYFPSESEIKQALEEEIKGKQKQSLKEALFCPGKQKSYLIAAFALLFLWIISGRLSPLYPILAALLLFFFTMSQIRKQRQN